MAPRVPLRLLHSADSLVASKLDVLRGMQTEALVASLAPGTAGALRVTRDGTVLNGNHRIAVLTERGVDVDGLPREVYEPVGVE